MGSENSQNSHIFDYLRYYKELNQPPRYAVMITGPWGCGKTHLIKDFLTETIAPNQKNRATPDFLYISLYGISSREQIDEAILRALYPVLNSRSANIGRKFGRGILRFLRFEVNVDAWDLLDKYTPRMYFFDDLERASIDPEACLGYINEFVEHGDCKVIIACNYSEIKNKDSFDRTLEKVVGKTLEVKPSTSQALNVFIAEFNEDSSKKLLSSAAGELRSIYDLSGLYNLRILRQSIHDCLRLLQAIDEGVLPDINLRRRMVLEFFALSLEVKAGRLAEVDLIERDSLRSAHRLDLSGSVRTPRLEAADERYIGLDFHETVLDEKLLAEFLFRGSSSSPDFSKHIHHHEGVV
ncbi:KAP family NTPase [Neorhizobium galegae]|uniref:P-loop NTPase fold protein n=1 Tax=Neorhizobium galegae TaxID=399 RepID=UPI00210076FB|nr:KAP family NTPase [Neorhizobium galegae]